MIKRMHILFIFMVILSVISSSTLVNAETDKQIDKKVYGKFAIALNAETGEVLYSKKGYERHYPSSMTKVMTAILLAEYIKPGTVLTASKHAVTREGSTSQFSLRVGERMTREEALEAMIILSANDVAAMIGEQISGSEVKFGQLMTKRAKELGAKHTKFVNASGLQDPNNYTTAYDMALIFKEVMKHPEITTFMNRKDGLIETNQRKVKVQNIGSVYKYPQIKYGKIGWNPESGNNIVALVQYGNKKVITCVMQSKLPHHYKDTLIIAKYAADKIDKTPPKPPVVNPVNINSTAITGTAEPNATIFVLIGDKTLSRVVDGKGKYSIPIPKQKVKTILYVYVKDKAGNVSSKKKVIVK